MKPSLVQIVPRLPPALDGVGDYAWLLARHLEQRHDITSRFLVAEPGGEARRETRAFNVTTLPGHRAFTLKKALDQIAPREILLVHYVGYGYQNRGVPFWLARPVIQWCADRSRPKPAVQPGCVLMFHELWSSGRPWQSQFYLHWAQWWLARALHRAADVSVTSTARMRHLLEKVAPKQTVRLPIPSNFSLPAHLENAPRGGPPFRILIFGQTGSRVAAAQAHARLVRELHRRAWLDRVIIAGQGAQGGGRPSPDAALLRALMPERCIEIQGEKSPDEAAALFSQADLFLSFYPASLACKSGVFMAALACGCPALLCDGQNDDGLEPDKHFVVCDGSPEQVDALGTAARNGVLAKVREAGRQWYLNNADWPVIAGKYAAILQGQHGF